MVFSEILQNLQENPCASLFFNKVADLRPEFCKISENTFFTEQLWATASDAPPIFDILESCEILVCYLLFGSIVVNTALNLPRNFKFKFQFISNISIHA